MLSIYYLICRKRVETNELEDEYNELEGKTKSKILNTE